ncbi:helix-turn-helix domain-containing protein [Rhodanobacter terrae]|uniref:Helix-turn-helix domain-containing protein n=1 Tax=Rhodanobacter terrae TaxID=418647 RepID=A0ABW0T2T5_9GAMM
MVSFGNRLHAAREARGLDLEACAHTLKLPARVLRQLERDQYDGIDSKVYLASYIGKYGRHLGINEASIQVELDRIKQVEPVLVATGGISHSRFLLDRYATAATYVVLTAVIVVPMIWLGVRGTLDRDLSHLSPLDAAPVAQVDAPAAASTAAAGGLASRVVPSPSPVTQTQRPEEPLMASMAPFPNLDNDSVASVKPVVPAVEAGNGGHSLSLSLNLSSASWVEVVDSAGARLEYGLLPAGSNKTYHSDQPLDVRIGNASGAQISIDGQPVGLDDFRHANVARFRVQMQDGKASAASL